MSFGVTGLFHATANPFSRILVNPYLRRMNIDQSPQHMTIPEDNDYIGRAEDQELTEWVVRRVLIHTIKVQIQLQLIKLVSSFK